MADISKIQVPGSATQYNIKDAQARRDIEDVKADLDAIVPGLSDDAKAALMACFAHVTWDGDSSSYMDDLRTALGIVVNPFEDAEYQIGGGGYNQNLNNNTGCVSVNSTNESRIRTVVPVPCKRGTLVAKTGYEINAYLLNSTSYGDWYTTTGIKITGYNDVAYIGTSYYQWAAQKEILTGTNYVLVVVRKTSGEAFTQEEAAEIYGTGFTYEEVSA